MKKKPWIGLVPLMKQYKSPSELGRLADARGDKRSTRMFPRCIISAGLANRI